MGRTRADRLLWIILVVLLSSPFKIYAIRSDIGLPGKLICRNTVQGRYLLSDDNGYVCTALSVDSWSRCCPEKGERFSCQGCNLVSQCCNSYEYCVSCCLNPTKTHEDLALKVKIAKPVTAGTYVSIFDFCAGRCRHNSASVVHENAYVSDFHHCFSLQSNTSGAMESTSEAKLAGIDVVIGKQGESCNSACKERGQSCVPNRLFVLNSCESLQKYMRCKGSCFASMGSDQPAEVADDAPKNVVIFCLKYHTNHRFIVGVYFMQHCRKLLSDKHCRELYVGTSFFQPSCLERMLTDSRCSLTENILGT